MTPIVINSHLYNKDNYITAATETGPEIESRFGPGYSNDNDFGTNGIDYDTSGGNTESGYNNVNNNGVVNNANNNGGFNNVNDNGGINSVNLGPRSLSLCTPLSRPECGLMGDMKIWTEMLKYVEVF